MRESHKDRIFDAMRTKLTQPLIHISIWHLFFALCRRQEIKSSKLFRYQRKLTASTIYWPPQFIGRGNTLERMSETLAHRKWFLPWREGTNRWNWVPFPLLEHYLNSVHRWQPCSHNTIDGDDDGWMGMIS
jgi:hypothetical protein